MAQSFYSFPVRLCLELMQGIQIDYRPTKPKIVHVSDMEYRGHFKTSQPIGKKIKQGKKLLSVEKEIATSLSTSHLYNYQLKEVRNGHAKGNHRRGNA